MTHVAIVYHSGYGHTEVLAQHVAKGADTVANTKTTLIKVEDADNHWETLEQADAIIFGAPTYMGSVSGPFKVFMDKTSKPWFAQKWKDKIAAGFTNSGSYSGDKLQSLVQLAILAAQHGMIWVSAGLASTGKGPEDINRIGSYLGLMAQSDNGAGPDIAPPIGDRNSAEAFGKRIAEVTAQFKK